MSSNKISGSGCGSWLGRSVQKVLTVRKIPTRAVFPELIAYFQCLMETWVIHGDKHPVKGTGGKSRVISLLSTKGGNSDCSLTTTRSSRCRRSARPNGLPSERRLSPECLGGEFTGAHGASRGNERAQRWQGANRRYTGGSE